MYFKNLSSFFQFHENKYKYKKIVEHKLNFRSPIKNIFYAGKAEKMAY